LALVCLHSQSFYISTDFSLSHLKGTWKSGTGEVASAVEFALKNGYKHIDTATAYGNEAEVGAGIQASGVPRESFFLVTKLNNNDHKKVEEALEYSLKQLKTDYLDLCERPTINTS